MTGLTATYRIQLREHLDFAGVAMLGPYLAGLGISHVYLSPICTATPGSTHGYDAIDFNEIEPMLGGIVGFVAMKEALREHGLRLIVDFVPNHMAASPLNGWWRDVLEWGAASIRAGHFDVDWSAPKLLVPVLGEPYGEALSGGSLSLKHDPTSGSLALTYHAIELPLTPPSYAGVIARMAGDPLQELARRFASATPDTADDLKRELAEAIAADAAPFEAIISAFATDESALHELHEAQVWRLAHWRTSRESLTYRRFFEISDLVGVRVENPRVFDDVHRCILALVSDGRIDGLRIDHVDGLADPLGYLRRLEVAMGADRPLILVEKILGAMETVRKEWPVSGTTGYEFIGALASLLVDGDRAEAMDRAYSAFVGSEAHYEELLTDLKRRTLTRNLAGELDILMSQAHALAQRDIRTRDLGLDTLRRAIIEVAAALPVYRTYVDAAGAREEDRRLLSEAAHRAKMGREVEDETAIDFIVQLVTLALPTPDAQATALTFAVRLQQTTGPLMAKALEDTLFYRYNRLIALNEVGSEPVPPETGAGAFHAAMIARQLQQPSGLSATSTHDTKRGEDGRTRIFAISEIAEQWSDAAQRWSGMNSGHRRELAGGSAPEPEMEWFFYQSLVGAWPADLEPGDSRRLGELKLRMTALMQKAAREAKLRTSWALPDEDYETSLAGFVHAALDPSQSERFLGDFHDIAAPLIVAGALTSLTQLLLKLTAPGVPDIYQGTELWDLSLVDPDNRRAVDFARRQCIAGSIRQADPRGLIAGWRSGEIKFRLLADGLALRRELDGWDKARHVAIDPEGEHARHIVGLARMFDDDAVIAIGVRLPVQLLDGRDLPHVAPERWDGTRIPLPRELQGATLFNVVTGERHQARQPLTAREILGQFPVALLSTRPPSVTAAAEPASHRGSRQNDKGP